MLTSEARVETERSGRYLIQICSHIDQRAGSHSEADAYPYRPESVAHLPPTSAHVQWSDNRGVVSLGWGRCTLRADPGVLTLRAEAPDEENLQRMKELVGGLVQRFGKRDRLTVTWKLVQGAADQPVETAARHNRGGQAHG